MHTECHSVALQFHIFIPSTNAHLYISSWINARKWCKSQNSNFLKFQAFLNTHFCTHFFPFFFSFSFFPFSDECVHCGKCQKMLAFVYDFLRAAHNISVFLHFIEWFLFDFGLHLIHIQTYHKNANYEPSYRVIALNIRNMEKKEKRVLSRKSEMMEMWEIYTEMVKWSYFFRSQIFITQPNLILFEPFWITNSVFRIPYATRKYVYNTYTHERTYIIYIWMSLMCVSVHDAYVVSFHFIWNYKETLQVRQNRLYCINALNGNLLPAYM